MNADAFRQLYDYHFAMNRHIWETYISQLSEEQFQQPLDYSMGSVCNQLIHLMNVDRAWFSDLRGVEGPDWRKPEDFPSREAIRAHWDTIETDMRGYLGTLTDAMLMQKPFPAGEDENLFTWQALIQVFNHGTDHRAQVLRQLHDLGVKTEAQDFIFYAYDRS